MYMSKEPAGASGEASNEQTRKRRIGKNDEPATTMCTVVAIDYSNFTYRVCSVCEKTLPDNPAISCRYCNFSNSFNPGTSGSKRLFRVLMSIATDTEVFVVIMFDRAARVLFGCSADEFFNFAKTHPYADMAASTALTGEMLTVALSNPKNGNARHRRVVSVVPLRTGFQPAIEILRELYRAASLKRSHIHGGQGRGGCCSRQTLHFADQFVRGRWFFLFSSLIILCGGQGALYLFGIYSKELKASLGYDQSTVSKLSFAQDLGCNIGILPGLLGEVAPAWLLLVVSSGMNFSGFFTIWLAVTHKIKQPHLWQMCALMFTGANSLMFAATAVFVSVLHSFPENRGFVIGLLKGFMGLSGAIMTQIYLAIYGNDPKSLILLMAWLPLAIYFSLGLSIRTHKPAKNPNERRAFYHFLYASILLALSLLAITILQKALRFTRAAYAGTASVLYVLLLVHLLLALKEEWSVWTKSRRPLSSTPAQVDSGKPVETESILKPVPEPTNLNQQPKTSWWKSIVNKPERGEDYSILQALLSVDMLCLFIATMCGIGSNLTAIDNLGQIGQSLGYPSTTVGTFVSLVSIWSYAGRIFAGFYSEHLLVKYKFPRTLCTTFFLLLSCIGYILVAFPTTGSVYAASVLIGLSFGAQFSLLYIIISELFGIKHYAMLSNCGQLACPLGSYILNVKIAGHLYDREALKSLAARGIERQAGMSLTCMGNRCYKATFTRGFGRRRSSPNSRRSMDHSRRLELMERMSEFGHVPSGEAMSADAYFFVSFELLLRFHGIASLWTCGKENKLKY